MRVLVSGLLLLAAAVSSPASALEQDGEFFLQSCGVAVKLSDGQQISDEERLRGVFCVAYLSGFLDSLTLSAKFSSGKKVVCLPERGISNDQAARLLTKYLRDNPEMLHESGRMSFYITLQKTFPCGK